MPAGFPAFGAPVAVYILRLFLSLPSQIRGCLLWFSFPVVELAGLAAFFTCTSCVHSSCRSPGTGLMCSAPCSVTSRSRVVDQQVSPAGTARGKAIYSCDKGPCSQEHRPACDRTWHRPKPSTLVISTRLPCGPGQEETDLPSQMTPEETEA